MALSSLNPFNFGRRSRETRPSPPSAEDEQQFVEWLLRYGKDFEIYRVIYRSGIEKYVRINLDAVMKELNDHSNIQSLRDRLGKMSTFYVEEFMPIVEAQGGIRKIEPRLQADIAMLQIKLQIIQYILKYKYSDKLTAEQEKVCGPLEEIYSE